MNELIQHFSEIRNIIIQAQYNALRSVNEKLIQLYWQVGEYVSNKLTKSGWGDGIVNKLVEFLKKEEPLLSGFTRPGIYRMVQFYDTYTNPAIVSTVSRQLLFDDNQCNEFVSTLLRQISWSHHLEIMSACKLPEEKVFYLIQAPKERWSVRELRRQIKSSLFERTMMGNLTISAAVKDLPQSSKVLNVFKDSYVFEFLNLSEPHKEIDLQRAIVANLKKFLIELGSDFAFIGEEYKLQVGMRDFRIDLLFYHRELQCLVAFDLKTDMFEPEYLGKINFYLEALDRDVRKLHENPSIGVLLCKSKDDVLVEYALSRTMNPAMVAVYNLKMPNKKMLQDKWQEILELAERGIKS